jgi:hypothetical protein
LQLTGARRAIVHVAFAALAFARPARADWGTFETSHTVYTESATRTKMFVYTPGADLEVRPTDWLAVRAGWEADVVSGASVAVKAGPAYQAAHPGADVVSTASVHDLRNRVAGGVTLTKDEVSVTGGYAYSTENDYRSHTLEVSAKTDTNGHASQFEIGYARNFDSVCDRVQAADDPVERFRALEDSSGCFQKSNPLRTTRDVAIEGLQGSWTQAWTSIFATQLVYTAQIVNGFQSSPYRSVILAEGLKAQEHEPDNRAREALALRANLFIRPLKAAVHLGVRAYWDTWNVASGTVEGEFEKYLGESVRLAARGRVYRQSGAIFWSDDYTGGDPPLGPKGQYWTGDRELSPLTSWLVGLRAKVGWSPAAGEPNARLLGLFTEAKASASADYLDLHYDEYTLGGASVGGHAFLFSFGGTLVW